jgi:N utilization substance protein A
LELKGVGPKTIEKLEATGITSVEKLADMTPEQLIEIPGIGEKLVERIHQAVAAYFEAIEAQATSPVEAAGVAPQASETPESGEPTGDLEVGGTLATETAAEAEARETAESSAAGENPQTTEEQNSRKPVVSEETENEAVAPSAQEATEKRENPD